MQQRGNEVDYRRDASRGVDVLRARFLGHAFEPHVHETYALGVTLSGRQSFRHRGARHTSVRGRMIVFNPDELHDGEAEGPDGFAYWMLYPDPGVWEDLLRQAGAGNPQPFFAQALQEDPALARLLAVACEAIWQKSGPEGAPAESLRADSLLDLALAGLAARHGAARLDLDRPPPTDPTVVRIVRESLEEEYAGDITLTDLAARTGRDRFHVNRVFRRATGLPPHRYLTKVRLQRAKALLAAGEPAAEVAAAVGLSDQSHLIRRFKGAYGITPGAFQAAHRGAGTD